jgi:hypothetical protein
MNNIPTKTNPLQNYMRQPKIYIRLPSDGNFWQKNSLVVSDTGEYPVYSMTAKDELALKVPDALISGQAIVNVIQNCMPNIKNAWAIPNTDLDVILIAIRIATYGEKLKLPLKIGEGDDEKEFEYEIDLRYIMSNLIDQIRWEDAIQVLDDVVVYVKPTDYKQLSNSALKTFETQRILQIVNDQSVSDEDKAKTFKDSIDKLNDMTVGLVNSAVYKIDTTEGSTDDPRYIKEFMNNVDKEIFDKIKNHIEILREHNNIKPVTINPNEEMIAQGFSAAPITVPLSFDPSTFFA